MTIALSANTPRVSYTVSQGATQTSFTVPFVFFTASTDLNVFVDGTERTFDASTSSTTLYTVSGGNGSTGTVTTSVTGVTGGSTVVITRDIPLSRTTDFPSSGAFEIAKLNTELDTLTAIQSDFNDNVDRTIRLQEFDDAATMTLPLKDARKGTVLGFNATTGAVEAGPTITAVQSLSDVTASIALLGTSAVVTDMGLLATSANVTAMGHLGTSANVTAMGLLGTSDVVADMALLGTSDVVADMALLATTDVIADMAQLANTTIIDDLAQLANTTITDDMAILATSDNVTAMGLLGTSANVTAMGLLGTSAVVEDMGFLGTSANVTAMGLLGTSANVTAMGLLGTSAVVTDMSLLGTSAVVTDMDILATSANVTNMATLGASGVVGNIATVAGVASNVTTVANNISGVNSFAERYRVQSGVPSSDNHVGDLVFDTAANTLKVFGSSGFQNAGSSVNGTSERFTYNITGTPTTLTGASGTGFTETGGKTLAYDAGFLDVYLNGVKMVNGTDVTVTSGDSVVFASALSNGDVVDIVTFGTFQVATLNASNLASGTVPVARVSGSYTSITGTGALNAGSITSGFGNINTGSSTITTTGQGTFGTLAVNGATTITTADNTTQLTLKSTDTDSGVGPILSLSRDNDSASDDDLIGQIHFFAEDDGNNQTKYSEIFCKIVDASDGSEDGRLHFNVLSGGSNTEFMRITGSDGVVFNEDSGPINFRVESDNNANMLFVDGGNNKVGIGTNSPAINLETSGSMAVSDTSTATKRLQLDSGASEHTINSANYGSDMMDLNIQAENLILKTGLVGVSERMRINSDGNVGIGTSSPDRDLVFGGGGGGSGVDIHDVGSTGQIRIGKTLSGTTSAMIFKSSNSTVGTINFSNSSTSYNTTSDHRVKENVEDMTGAIDRVKQLSPKRFNFISDDTNTLVDGFLAHEAQSVVVEAVTGTHNEVDDDGNAVMQGIDQAKLVPLLTGALKEAITKIEALETRITALESA